MDFLSGRRATVEERPRVSFSDNRIGNNFISRILSRNKHEDKQIQELNQVIDVDNDLRIFKQNQLNLLNPKTLYNTGYFARNNQLYRHYREEQISVTGEEIVTIDLVNPESLKKIVSNRLTLMHMGLIVVGLKGLTRKNLGTKVLVVIYDDRWSDLKKSVIGLTEVDMTNNGGIFYVSPDFMINLGEFGRHIKIGIQTKGYEEMEGGNNLLMCIGFIGKMALNSNTRFKLKVADVVEVMGNKGIKLIKPIKINPEEYAGLEWNLEQFNKKKILKPESHLMYTNARGETSIRFTNYKYSNHTDFEDEIEDEIEPEAQKEFMNIEIIQEGYEVDEVLQEAERRYKENKDITFKCKGCRTGNMNIEIIEKHFKTCLYRIDNLGYRDNCRNIKRLEVCDKILDNLCNSDEEIEKSSIISQKELMESTSSSASPFQRTAQQNTIDTSTGNVPRRRVFRVNPETPITENIRPMGRRMPIEEPIRLQEGGSKGKILNIAAHDPQMWNTVIDLWKGIVVADYIKTYQDTDAETMYKYMETFLGESAKALWEAYKSNFPQEFQVLVNMGPNPYNFTNKVHSLITGEDPNSGLVVLQRNALIKLEQLSISSWLHIKNFLKDYYYYCTISGNSFDDDLGKKLFNKLPGALGREIEDRWYKRDGVIQNPNGKWSIGHKVQHVMEILTEKCTNIQIQKQLKQNEMSFCKNVIYTTQSYDKEKPKKKFKKRPYYQPYNNRRYYLRRSSAKKPYLNKDRHVRKYRNDRNYKNKLECFTCGSIEHLANVCPKRNNNRTRNSQLIEDFQETLINVDEYMSDNESIYSVVSVEMEERNYSENSDSDNEEFINEIGMELKDLDLELSTMMNISQECNHEFERNKGIDSNQCVFCKWYPSRDKRAKCKFCYAEGCIECIENLLKIKVIKQERYDNKEVSNDIINLRIITLENRMNELERKVIFLEKGKEKMKEKTTELVHKDKEWEMHGASTQEAELMSIDTMVNHYEGLICNEDKKFTTIKILARLKIQDIEIETLALVDTGCTGSIINKKILPQRLIKTLDKPIAAMQMDGTYNTYQHYIGKTQVSFINTCNNFYKPTYTLDRVWVRDLNINIDFVLGLKFMIQNNGGTLITRDGVIFFKQLTYTPVQTTNYETKGRHTDISPENQGEDNLQTCCKDCTDNKQCCTDQHEKYEEEEEEYDIREKDYVLIEIENEFYNFQVGIEKIGNIKSPKDLENIVQILDEMEIIGEKPLKYWENNKVVCKLEIINPEYIIKTAAIEATNQDLEDFGIQIKELLNLGVIRRSTSQHRSAAFMVRNHSEILRGKARMVINYKRLNDNTRTDAYKLPDKSELINRIQGKRYLVNSTANLDIGRLKWIKKVLNGQHSLVLKGILNG